MRQIFAYENQHDFEKYQQTSDILFERLLKYKNILEEEYDLLDAPKAVVWTSKDIAVNILSSVPVPAYTSRDVIFMTPDKDEWKEVMTAQLDGREDAEVASYYASFDERQILTILAHELTHHIEFFPDDFDDYSSGIWFEEGMCEYLPRRILMDDEAFNQEVEVHSRLLELFEDKYGERSVEDFGSDSYNDSMSGIMFNYWKSFITVKYVVEELYDGDIQKVFKIHNDWHENYREQTFSEYLGIDV